MTHAEFEHKAHELRPLMLRVATAFFPSADDVEDATQEAMLKLWQYCERIDPERNVEGLAVRVAKNCCVSWHRRQSSIVTLPYATPPAPPPSLSSIFPSPHEMLEAKEAKAALSEVIARLKPRERELFEMRQIEGLSIDEIATQTGILKTSVKAMISTARKKVLTELKQRLRQ